MKTATPREESDRQRNAVRKSGGLLGLSGAAALGFLPHAFGDDADFLDTRALGRVDDVDDLTVAKRRRAGDEQRLVLALLEDGSQPAFHVSHRHVLLVDRDTPVGRVLA